MQAEQQQQRRNGQSLQQTWLGTHVKHHMGQVAIKMYDKFSFILHNETTINNVSFFKHYIQVQHDSGTATTKWAEMKEIICSLHLPYIKSLTKQTNIISNRFIHSYCRTWREETTTIGRDQNWKQPLLQGFQSLRRRWYLFITCYVTTRWVCYQWFYNQQLH